MHNKQIGLEILKLCFIKQKYVDCVKNLLCNVLGIVDISARGGNEYCDDLCRQIRHMIDKLLEPSAENVTGCGSNDQLEEKSIEHLFEVFQELRASFDAMVVTLLDRFDSELQEVKTIRYK